MKHLFGIFFSPRTEWAKIRDENNSVMSYFVKYVAIVGLLPPIAWYFGATEIGWTVGGRVVRITPESALPFLILFYFAILIGVAGLGFMVHWMSETYEAETSTFSKGISIAAYTCAPLLICGATGFYPILWLDIILGCVAAGYAVYLLYIGVPIVMQIPEERGFLFASAMVGVGLVGCAALLGATVIFWEMGAMPVFTD